MPHRWQSSGASRVAPTWRRALPPSLRPYSPWLMVMGSWINLTTRNSNWMWIDSTYTHIRSLVVPHSTDRVVLPTAGHCGPWRSTGHTRGEQDATTWARWRQRSDLGALEAYCGAMRCRVHRVSRKTTTTRWALSRKTTTPWRACFWAAGAILELNDRLLLLS
jgi:hypothetical protein